MEVVIQSRKHRHIRFLDQPEARKLIGEALEKAGYQSERPLTVYLGKGVRGNYYSQGVTIPPTGLRGNCITMLVQTGDNGTRFECHARIQAEKPVVKSLFDRLRQHLAKERSNGADPATIAREDGTISAGEEVMSAADSGHEEPRPATPAADEPVQPAEPMSTEGRKKLDVKMLTTDRDQLGVLLLSLHEHEKGETLDGRTCLRLLQAAVSTAYSLRSFPFLLEHLVRKGYVERLGKKKGCAYRVSPAGLELIGVKPSVQQKAAPVSSGQRHKQLHVLVEEHGALKEKEEQLVSDQQKIDTEEARLQARLGTIQTLRAGIKKKLDSLTARKEEIALQIQEALKR